MASVTYGNAVRGLKDLKVTNIAGSSQEDLGAATMLEAKPVLDSDILVGDDAVKAAVSYPTHLEWSITNGEFSSAALAIMTGITLATSGSTPNEITEFQMNESVRFPYFKVYGQALDEGVGDFHVLIWKCKIQELGSIAKLENGNWRVNEISGVALNDSTHGLFEVIQHETAAAVPTS